MGDEFEIKVLSSFNSVSESIEHIKRDIIDKDFITREEFERYIRLIVIVCFAIFTTVISLTVSHYDDLLDNLKDIITSHVQSGGHPGAESRLAVIESRLDNLVTSK